LRLELDESRKSWTSPARQALLTAMKAPFKPLESMTVTELRQCWHELLPDPPSPNARREFLIGNIHWQRQASLHGGLGPHTIRELKTMATGGKPKTGQEVTLRPGAKLIRMWKGQPHEVHVLAPKSYQYGDETFSSLTAIANRITGTRWNGKLFFGLRKK
jgi:hypothetical protein